MHIQIEKINKIKTKENKIKWILEDVYRYCFRSRNPLLLRAAPIVTQRHHCRRLQTTTVEFSLIWITNKLPYIQRNLNRPVTLLLMQRLLNVGALAHSMSQVCELQQPINIDFMIWTYLWCEYFHVVNIFIMSEYLNVLVKNSSPEINFFKSNICN